MENERIKLLKNLPVNGGKYVLYWMQASQRVFYNHALNFAIKEANRLNLPVLVVFGLTPNFPGANLRHYKFMLEGLIEVCILLKSYGIGFIMEISDQPFEIVIKYSTNAALVVFDKGYTRIQKIWRIEAFKFIEKRIYEIESDVVVPVEIASDKEEYSAFTLRKKLLKKLKYFLTEVDFPEVNKNFNLNLLQLDKNNPESKNNINKIDEILKILKCDKSVLPSSYYKGSYSEAKKRLDEFIEMKINYYDQLRNDPSSDFQSNLSPYIHFGQISTLEITLRIIEKLKEKAFNIEQFYINQFLEELIVRRELAINFVYYNDNYDNLNMLPLWAKKTLKEHENDKREYIYSLSDFENAKTHDIYWNAAQMEMVKTGKMHGYMRMYWGKKVIEWTKFPQDAFEYLIYLNDKYEIDGRDPNGYAGIAWCFGKHDRPWAVHKIFGNIRYMNDKGLERKFDMKEYIKKVNKL
ncbi:MAG: deoxyribodipyrimidine photo-lyase [Exilispira sp.]